MVYTVKQSDSCVAIGVDLGTTWQQIVAWNSGIDSLCSNIVGAVPSWGTTICVSPPGGRYIGVIGGQNPVGGGNSGGQGGSGDGYAEDRVDPPSGAKVANGTTARCGIYFQAQDSDDCARVLAPGAIPMDLFIKANPSLVDAISCTSKLLPSVYYCLRPTRY